MTYIYHGCPETMIGTVLYPLNELRIRHPDIYRQEMAKYADHPKRVSLPETVLPKLDCLWNDVLHCSPIHPRRLYEAWRAQGIKSVPDKGFFRIPINRVSHHRVAIMRGRDVEWLDAVDYKEITTVTAETLKWYGKMARQGRFGGHFVGVPHVLVEGAIDIEGVEVVRWSDPSSMEQSGRHMGRPLR